MLTQLQKDFKLLWGEAPKGSPKYEKGKAVWKFIIKAYNKAKRIRVNVLKDMYDQGRFDAEMDLNNKK